MNWSQLREKSIDAINKEDLLLVFPVKNKEEYPSLWRSLYPRSRMKWEWDDSADNKVVRLWHIREELSRSGEVVYAKWFQDRATFISKELFVPLYRVLNPDERLPELSFPARRVLDALEDSSPRATKELRKEVGLKGKENEAQWNRSMKELWRRLLIVGWGEKAEGAFPSLQMGASSLIFEELHQRAFAEDPIKMWERLEEFKSANLEAWRRKRKR